MPLFTLSLPQGLCPWLHQRPGHLDLSPEPSGPHTPETPPPAPLSVQCGHRLTCSPPAAQPRASSCPPSTTAPRVESCLPLGPCLFPPSLSGSTRGQISDSRVVAPRIRGKLFSQPQLPSGDRQKLCARTESTVVTGAQRSPPSERRRAVPPVCGRSQRPCVGSSVSHDLQSRGSPKALRAPLGRPVSSMLGLGSRTPWVTVVPTPELPGARKVNGGVPGMAPSKWLVGRGLCCGSLVGPRADFKALGSEPSRRCPQM